jgi:NAD(P)-dependent dehydrogenase (short-subunit alcohol dehydrogenase family)
MEFGGGKVAIITGGSRGIGAGLVEAFRKHGYRVIANSRTITDSRTLKSQVWQAISPIQLRRNALFRRRWRGLAASTH